MPQPPLTPLAITPDADAIPIGALPSVASGTILPALSRLLPGTALAALIAGLAAVLHRLPGFGLVSPLCLALGVGMLVGNLFALPDRLVPGITFALRQLLRIGVALLGLQLTVAQLATIGVPGLAMTAVVLVASFLVTLGLGRWLGVDPGLTRLIATGTAVCGAAAVAAANGVVRCRDENVAYALAVVTIFGSASMLLYPLLETGLGLSPHAYGLWAGSSIHEVAQVVGAGYAEGQDSGEVATISKLARVLLLAPVIVVLAWSVRRSQSDNGVVMDRPPLMPWFITCFLALVALNSLGLVPAVIQTPMVSATPWLLAAALGALGLETRLDRLRSQGLRPLLVGAGAWLFIAGFGLALAALLEPILP